MEETIEFYGFRGNIIFPDQVTLFSMGFENKSKDKNQVFKKFFEDLKDELKKTNITKNTFTEIADNFIDYLGILEDILLNDANNLKDISGANIIEKIKKDKVKIKELYSLNGIY